MLSSSTAGLSTYAAWSCRPARLIYVLLEVRCDAWSGTVEEKLGHGSDFIAKDHTGPVQVSDTDIRDADPCKDRAGPVSFTCTCTAGTQYKGREVLKGRDQEGQSPREKKIHRVMGRSPSRNPRVWYERTGISSRRIGNIS